MHTDLGRTTLKTGETMTIARIDGPCPAWRDRLMSFLEHKGEEWREHIDLALTSPLDELQSHFYVGLVTREEALQTAQVPLAPSPSTGPSPIPMGEGWRSRGEGYRPACHILVSASRGVALLGHVFTAPEHRQKGAIKSLMDVVIADCDQAGIRVITLGTVFDTPPFHIYKGFGFEPITDGSGWMIRGISPTASTKTYTRPLRWDDWPALNLLSIQPVAPGENGPRSIALGISTVGSAEGPFINFQLLRKRHPGVDGAALVDEAGNTVGWSTIVPVERLLNFPLETGHPIIGEGSPATMADNGDNPLPLISKERDGVRPHWVLDAYIAPGYVDGYDRLIAATPLPDVPITAYVDGDGPRTDALKRAGFSTDGPRRLISRT